MASDYRAFIACKVARAPMRGLADVPALASHLFPFQADCVDFALKAGSAGIFLDTGLGKTAIELEWCRHAAEATNGLALILTPLAVARQIEAEAHRWGYEARVIREQEDAGPGINICNYDRLDRLDPSRFGAVALDEASILKSFGGKTSRALIERFRDHRFRLAATATPAPNDHMELGQYAEFLGVMSGNEMLSRWFINDTSTASQEWRLKGHAVSDFWSWMASWARMAEKPADLGDTSISFDLPALKVHRHKAAETDIRGGDGLFAQVEMSATQMHEVKRQTAQARAEKLAEIIAADPDEAWVIWCDTDYEADAIKAAIDAGEIRGSQSIEEKEDRLAAFVSGAMKRIITKPSLTGFGLNWQHCARVAYVGRSFSYETWYQSVRRCWRFGQPRDVHVHLIVAEGEAEIGRVIERKAASHADMKRAMRDAMARAQKSSAVKVPYNPTHDGSLPSWL